MPQPISFRTNTVNPTNQASSRPDDASQKDLMEDRRLSNRKQDWDASMYAKSRPPQPRGPTGSRDQYKPDGRANGPSKSHSKDFEAGLGPSLRTEKHDKQSFKNLQDRPFLGHQFSRRNSAAVEPNVGTLSHRGQLGPKTPTKPSPKALSKPVTSSDPSTNISSAQPSQNTLHSLESGQKKDRLLRMFDDDDEKQKSASLEKGPLRQGIVKQPDNISEKTVEKPVEIPAEKSSEISAEKPAEKSAEKSAEKPAEKSSEKSSEKYYEKLPEKATEVPKAESVEKSTEVPKTETLGNFTEAPKEFTEKDNKVTTETPTKKDSDNTGVDNLEDLPASPSSTGFDTSILSPVGSTASDEAFAQTLNIIPESKADSDDNMELSEAETVIDDRSLNMSKSRRYLRKRGRDSFRERAKRRNVVYSEEDEDEDYSSDASDTPKDLDSKAIKDGSRFSNGSKDDHSDSDNLPRRVSRPRTPTKAKSNSPVSVPKDASSAPDKGTFKKENGPSSLQKRDSKPTYKIKRDSTGRSQLQRACKKGDLQEVKNLISRGASANESDFGGFTCLHEAALAGHTKIVEYLIENGADVNKQAFEAGDFETPLMDAAENKHADTVKVLLINGADPHLCNNEGYSTITKLFHLQEDDEEYEDVIKVINEFAPPQVDSELSKVTHTPREIIDDPSDGYFANLVKKKSKSLIYKYAAQGNKESAAEDFVTHSLSLLKMPDVLNLAARNGHVELVDILLGLNPGSFDINQVNKIGVTVLLATVGRGYYEVVKFLLSKGANPHIRRAKDGMSALEIAKHSAQYDPREVVVLEESMNDSRGEKSSKTTTPAIESGEKDTSKHSQAPSKKTETKSPVSKVDDGSSRDSGCLEKRDLAEPSKANLTENSHAGDEKNPHGDISKPKDVTNENRHTSTKRRLSFDELHSHKKVKKDIPEEAQTSEDVELEENLSTEIKESKLEGEKQSVTHEHPSLPVEAGKLPNAVSGLQSSLSSKAQEEQRIRAAEQAKIWQEKMQAKKKARKEMFLLAEKEKEKRRKEEEEKRLELLKKQEIEQRERRIREEIEAKKLAEELERKMQIMEHRFMLQNYPIGLQEAVFDGSFNREDRLRYTPLYIFNFDNDKWVIDMQIALILSIPVPQVHSIFEGNIGPHIDNASKDKLWSLFFKMIGVGRNNVIERNGMEKFRCLQLRYVRLAEISDWIKQKYSEAYEILWTENRLTTVDLASLESPQVRDAKTEPRGSILCADVGFIPPKFRHRGDVLKTIQTSNSPLW